MPATAPKCAVSAFSGRPLFQDFHEPHRADDHDDARPDECGAQADDAQQVGDNPLWRARSLGVSFLVGADDAELARCDGRIEDLTNLHVRAPSSSDVGFHLDAVSDHGLKERGVGKRGIEQQRGGGPTGAHRVERPPIHDAALGLPVVPDGKAAGLLGVAGEEGPQLAPDASETLGILIVLTDDGRTRLARLGVHAGLMPGSRRRPHSIL